jgi:molecular chaperone HtpG
MSSTTAQQASQPETFAFQAEINQLLSLIINTFYSNKEVFLRELISNASDAIDKIRDASLTSPEVLGDLKDFEIKITPDKETNTLTIQDTGVGMTKQDLIKNLGTIAHSGTRAFMESLKSGQTPDISLIGQFGVGFYSAYLVAQNVKVISKSNDDVQYIWESNASGSFTIREDTDGEPIKRGTKIVLELKDDHKEYLEDVKIKEIIKKHSEYCSFPIKCYTEREEEVEIQDEEPTPEKDGEVADEDAAPKIRKTEKRTVKEYTHVNTQPPIWQRKPEDVTQEEYATFYKSISNDWEEHLAVKHFSVEGSVQFKAALFIPKRPPFDMFQTAEKKRSNIKLYVRKVLITDDSTSILPDYLGFVQGVVDSDDLPLNVSREMLQQNNIMKVIRNNLVKKVIEMIQELEPEKFQSFYDAFNKNIKLGVHDDSKNKSKLVEIIKYYTTKSLTEPTSFKSYVSRMPETQKKIYYITGESLKAVQSSPFLEKLKKRDIEVLLMTDPIDEYMVQSLREYDGKELVCCSKEGLELEQTEDEKKAQEQLQKDWEPICNKIKGTLGDRVQTVKLSERLASNPCVLVTDRYGWSANMERIMKAQALRNSDTGMMGGSRKTLEINPEHPLLLDVKQRLEKDQAAKHIIEMLYQTTLIDSGFSLDEPSKYAQQIYKLMSVGLGAEEDDEVIDIQDEETDISKLPDTNTANTMEEVD